jgi:hypothetical protein
MVLAFKTIARPDSKKEGNHLITYYNMNEP